MAMPWKIAKTKAAAIRADTTGQMLADLNRLFDACFRIQAQASMAAGRRVPMIVENVRGAQPWVGRSRWAFGSFHLWGDVPALMPFTFNGTKLSDGTGTTYRARAAGFSAAWANRPASNSARRKMQTAAIAKIPLPLSRHIAAVYYPRG